MELTEPVDSRQARLLPVVQYAIARRLASSTPDYWDHASALELSVLMNDQAEAARALADAIVRAREAFEPETTQRNLRLIREARERRGVDCAWIAAIEAELDGTARSFATSETIYLANVP